MSTEYPWLKSLPPGPGKPPEQLSRVEVVPDLEGADQPPCDMCQGVGWLKDDTSPTGQSACPMCRGRRTNAWRQDVAKVKHQKWQVRQTLRLVTWVVIVFFLLCPIAFKGMWPFGIVFGLLMVKLFGWLRRNNEKRAEGSLT